MFEIHLGIPGFIPMKYPHLQPAMAKRSGNPCLENNTPKAGRIFWCYGPDKGSITIIGLEPHPEDKANSYKKITLSSMGKEI